MLIVGEQLRQLSRQFRICPDRNHDGDSLRLSLGRVVQIPAEGVTIPFQGGDRSHHFTKKYLENGTLELERGSSVLACTFETVTIPPGYFGVVKPTSSANRDFFSVTLGADHISAGWQGVLTLEVHNFGPFRLSIPVAAHVAQLFIHRSSDCGFTRKPEGRYQRATEPLFTLPETAQ